MHAENHKTRDATATPPSPLSRPRVTWSGAENIDEPLLEAFVACGRVPPGEARRMVRYKGRKKGVARGEAADTSGSSSRPQFWNTFSHTIAAASSLLNRRPFVMLGRVCLYLSWPYRPQLWATQRMPGARELVTEGEVLCLHCLEQGPPGEMMHAVCAREARGQGRE